MTQKFIQSIPSLADVEAIRLLLKGHSVIDWKELAFSSDEEVERFLRINEFDPADPLDMERLEQIREDAVDYLTRYLDYRIPEDVATQVNVQDLFLMASNQNANGHAKYACIVLKAMHVIHHLEGREILFRLPVSDDQVFGVVENKVMQMVEEIRGVGHAITEFAWSRKERESVLTKLLAKKESIAAHVYDKLRFRLIVREKQDLLPLVQEMLHRFVPFNYVIPGQTVNTLVPVPDAFIENEKFASQLPFLQKHLDMDRDKAPLVNSFSGSSYRVLNFIADLPIRVGAVLDHIQALPEQKKQFDPRSVIFVLTEFQLIDEQTQFENEQNENSHRMYKERQLDLVRARLGKGE